MDLYLRICLRTKIFRQSFVRRLKERFKGHGWDFESEAHVASREDRLAVLFSAVKPEAFAGKTVLEVGGGHGHLGAELERLGATVTSLDGRAENIRQLKKKFPNMSGYVCDVGSPELEKYAPVDIILAFGILYHLPRPDEFLERCARMSDILLLEGAVSDLAQQQVVWVKERGFYDQSIDGIGCRPSPTWVEEQLRSAGYNQVIDLSPAGGNRDGVGRSGVFYWEPTGSGTGTRYGDLGLRKMWVATKGGYSFVEGKFLR